MDDLTTLVKEKIKQKYKSIRNFSITADIPYTTVLSALEKGIGGTAVETVIKMCDLLEIDISTWQKNDKKITPSEIESEERLTAEKNIFDIFNTLDTEQLIKFNKILRIISLPDEQFRKIEKMIGLILDEE